jgi:type III secretion protein J
LLKWQPNGTELMEARGDLCSQIKVICILACIALVGCREQILHDLSEQDANKVLSRLSAAELGAQKVAQSDGRWAIAVPNETIVPALAFLDTHRVLAPRSVSSAGTKSGIVPSREEQWFRYERSVATVIEESIGALLGVLDARVHLNLPETDPLFGTRKDDLGSGSVLLVVDNRYVAKDEEVAALVAGAAGIPASRVTVLHSVAETRSEEIPAPSDVQRVAEIVHDTGAHVKRPPVWFSRTTLNSLGCVSAVILCIAAGVAFVRRRKRRVRFSLPDSILRED